MFKLFKIKFCLIVLLLSFSVNSIASDEISEWTIKFGGWSKHSEEKNMAGRDWNENHTGIGIKKVFKKFESDDLFDAFVEGFYMKDSYDMDSGYIGAGAMFDTPLKIEYVSVKFNVLAGVMQRSLHNYDEINDILESETKIRPSLMYYFTIEIMDNVDVDLTYIPKGTALIENEVFFFRLGYRF